MGKRGKHLCLAQKHTGNISCIRSMVIARPSYALRHSMHGVTGADGGKKKYPLNTLTEEKFYPSGTTDEYFEAPYEESPVTICGQTVILTNGKLAAALLSLPEKNREIIFLYFLGYYTQREIGKCTDAAGVRPGIKSAGLCNSCIKKWRCFHMRNPNLLPYETTVRATSGKPWTRFYGITASESESPPLNTGISTGIPRTA